MKLFKKMFCWAIILCCVFVGGKVKALDINDFEFEVVEEYLGTNLAAQKIYVRGEFEEIGNYYVKFVNENDPKPTDFENGKYPKDSNEDITKWKILNTVIDNDNQRKVSISDDWYMLNGYDYVYLLKCNPESCEISDTSIKLTRNELPKLGQRYQYYFIGEENKGSVYPYFPYIGKTGSHKMNMKMGVINDTNLLYSIYKQETDSMEKLLNYAKNNNGNNYSFSDSDRFNINISNLNIVDGTYYYIYTSYDNQDGLYRDLSDVTIAMAKNNMIINEITWDFVEGNDSSLTPQPTTTQAKVQNPKTEDLNTNAIIVMFIICVGLIIIGKKKLSKNY